MTKEEYHKKFNDMYGDYKPNLYLSDIELAASKKAYSWQSDENGNLTLEQFPEPFKRGFKAGAEWASPKWISVKEKLPSEDEEVIVLTKEAHGHHLPIAYHLCFAHIVSDKARIVDFDGWNIPEVKYWMPCPELPEK